MIKIIETPEILKYSRKENNLYEVKFEGCIFEIADEIRMRGSILLLMETSYFKTTEGEIRLSNNRQYDFKEDECILEIKDIIKVNSDTLRLFEPFDVSKYADEKYMVIQK